MPVYTMTAVKRLFMEQYFNTNFSNLEMFIRLVEMARYPLHQAAQLQVMRSLGHQLHFQQVGKLRLSLTKP